MKTVSYAITACNEIEELRALIEHIKPFVRFEQDEVILQIDSQKATQELKEYVEHLNIDFEIINTSFHRIFYPLNNNFAKFKNHLAEHCTKDYIFFIDADELPSENVLKTLPMILESNSNIDVFLVPRVNKVAGITEEHVQKWGWRIDEQQRINWPDYQMRIVRNTDTLAWEGKVHEKIVGFRTISHFPIDNEDWAIFHYKMIERQEKQNEFYNNI